MEGNNNLTNTEKTEKEDIVEGFEIVTEKATELDKKQFFKMLAGAEEGLTLTIDRVGNIFSSKYDFNKAGCFIDYSFTKDSKKYEIGIYYNLGKQEEEGTVKINSNMNVFLILAIAVDLTEADEIRITEEFIQKTLTGIKFKAEVGTSYNGTFLIEPVELLEG